MEPDSCFHTGSARVNPNGAPVLMAIPINMPRNLQQIVPPYRNVIYNKNKIRGGDMRAKQSKHYKNL